MPNDPLRSLRLVVAFAATHTPNGALNAEGALYDEAGLGDRSALAAAVAEARCDLRDLFDLIEAARAVDVSAPPGRSGSRFARALNALREALGPDGLSCPRCDGGCASPGRAPIPAGFRDAREDAAATVEASKRGLPLGSEHVETAGDLARLAERAPPARGSMTPAEFARRDAVRVIASSVGYGDLTERKSDRADFREVHVAKMREALERAFAAGVDHAARRLTLAVSDAADLGAGNHYALRVIGDAVRSLDEKGGA